MNISFEKYMRLVFDWYMTNEKHGYLGIEKGKNGTQIANKIRENGRVMGYRLDLLDDMKARGELLDTDYQFKKYKLTRLV